MKNSDINYFFLQGMMNSGHKGSKNSVHKGVNFHPTSTRVFRGPGEGSAGKALGGRQSEYCSEHGASGKACEHWTPSGTRHHQKTTEGGKWRTPEYPCGGGMLVRKISPFLFGFV